MKTIELHYEGKVAVITGAASGMGRLTALELAKAGAKTVLCDIDPAALDSAKSEIETLGAQTIAIRTDVRTYTEAEKAAEAAISAYGKIDLLFCYAGGNEARCRQSHRPFYEQPIDVIDWGIDVNLKGAVYFARACMPHMVRNKYGVIVCIGSVTGFEGDGCGAMYGTAKSGIFNFVKSLAKAGAPHSVRAFAVSPGPVLTREAMSQMKTLRGRASEPCELVDFILFCASERGESVIGSNLLVDCGHLLA